MSKRELKPEYQEGGAKRGEILAKAVKYLQDTKLMTTQADRQYFLLNVIGLSTTEYMRVLDKASGGALMESVWN
jgi:hypothetical protein